MVLWKCVGGMVCASALGAWPASAELRLEPISFKAADGTVVPAERGSFEVPENRLNPNSRKIRVSFVRFRSTNAEPADPIVYLAGGPGGTGSGAAAGPRFPIFQTLRGVADVIAFDQRGTGGDTGIPACPVQQAPDPSIPMNRENFADYYRSAYSYCWEFWRAQGVDIGGYDTRQSVEDLEDLRRHLGADRLNLWGISYGSHLALAMAKYHPRSVGRVALASAEGLDQLVRSPKATDAAFRRLAIASGFPDLPERMRRVHEKLDREPVMLTHRTADGKSISFTLTAYPIQLMAGTMVKNPADFPRLVQFYSALEAGAIDQIRPIIYQAFWRNRLTLTGMPEAMDLASGLSQGKQQMVARERGASLFSDAISFPFPHVLSAVPGADLGQPFRAPFRSNRPALLISGTLDVRIPVEEQREAVTGFRNLTHVVVENAGHDILESHPDIATILVDFFSGREVRKIRLSLAVPKAKP